MNQPLGDTNFDPLEGPGKKSSRSSLSSPKVTGPSYQPGQYVETAMPNSTFFNSIPKGNATADKVLPAGTPLKLIKTQGSYVKVSVDSGDVGYVPSIMVTERGAYKSPSIRPKPYTPPNRKEEIPVVPSIQVDTLPPLPDQPFTDPGISSDIAPPPVESTIPVPSIEPPSVEVPVTSPAASVPSVDIAPLPDLPPPPEVPPLSPPQPIE